MTEAYDPSRYPPVFVTVDLVVFTIRDDALQVLLIQRANPPHEGMWALPGGFIEPDEDLDEAARRELAEETGVDLNGVVIEQLGTYGNPHRDPRSRIVSVAYMALLPEAGDPVAGSDADFAEFQPWDNPLPLAFDHDLILADAVERARAKLEYTTYATAFLPERFTIGELRRVYEIIWGVKLDPANFHRKVTSIPNFLWECDGFRYTGGKPAKVYTIGTHRKTLAVPFRREQP